MATIPPPTGAPPQNTGQPSTAPPICPAGQLPMMQSNGQFKCSAQTPTAAGTPPAGTAAGGAPPPPAAGTPPPPPAATLPKAPAPAPAPGPAPAPPAPGGNYPGSASGQGPGPGPTPGGNAPTAPGVCPPDTAAGKASCCPSGTVWRTDTRVCEAPNARSNADKDTCTGADPHCPPGQTAWCDFDTASFKCASDPNWAYQSSENMAYAQSHGMVPGGAGAGAGGIGPSGLGGDFDALLKSYLMQLPGQSSFSPDVMNSIKAQAKAASMGSSRAAQEALNSELINRGMFSAPAAARQSADIERAGMGQYNQAVSQATIAKAQTDFQDKLAGLDRMQKYLDGLRQQGVSFGQLQLGYANIAAERENLQAQLAQQRYMGTVPLGQGGPAVPIAALPYIYGGL